MAKVIMVQGTMSGAGKSLFAAGLCRIFRQDGYRTVPFKSQNMSLNSFITKDGLEMGRAQVMQAECAGVEPSVYMNPILLKPSSDTGSQVIVNGRSIGNMDARDYFAYKKSLIPDISDAFKKLSEKSDIIVIEGAGSPAEINLRENDIVNMGMAELAGSNVLLVGDIDRGGVFAQLYGTVMLLEDKERERVKGLIINKFRGDKSLLDSGIDEITRMLNIPVAGVVPYMNISVDDEDSLTERFKRKEFSDKKIDIVVIRYPRISNFTDFGAFEIQQGVNVRYVSSVYELGEPDMIFLPGSKNTIEDLKFLRESGMEEKIKEFAEKKPVFGICGGLQMLGDSITDDLSVESGLLSEIRGMGLLDINTRMLEEKTRKQVEGKAVFPKGVFEGIKDRYYRGYELHNGQTVAGDNGVIVSDGNNVYGTYVHGLFDEGGIAGAILEALGKRTESISSYASFKDSQYDILADNIRTSCSMDMIYGLLREAAL